jgi:hypothetical protein
LFFKKKVPNKQLFFFRNIPNRIKNPPQIETWLNFEIFRQKLLKNQKNYTKKSRIFERKIAQKRAKTAQKPLKTPFFRPQIA